MNRPKCLLIVSGSQTRSIDLVSALKRRYTCFQLSLDQFTQASVSAVDGILIDIDLANAGAIERIRSELDLVDRSNTFVVCAINVMKSADIIAARSLGADEVVTIEASQSKADASKHSSFIVAGLMTIDRLLRTFVGSTVEPAAVRQAYDAGNNAMTAIFDLAQMGKPAELPELRQNGQQIVDALAEHGLARWVDKVRMHHSATYQHCLIVTGVAAAFGQSLGLAKKDMERLTLSGMLHDIGKAMIPIEILEKPGPLSEQEWETMRTHPIIGAEILARSGGFDSEMSDVVVHHHEYLDGSGYPHGLQGGEISDIVRVMTISDIFGALIERRPYKAEMSGENAYDTIVSMTTKLDIPLVRAFRRTAVAFPLSMGIAH